MKIKRTQLYNLFFDYIKFNDMCDYIIYIYYVWNVVEDADQYLPSLRQSQSMIEYLICTRINADDPSQHFSSPLIGFRITEHPCFLIALSVNGELTSLPLTSTTLVRQTKKVPAITEINDENDSQVRTVRSERITFFWFMRVINDTVFNVMLFRIIM